MRTSDQVKVLCVRSGVSLAELARRLGESPQNFGAKLKRGTLGQDELLRIAKVMNAQYEQYFVLSNGEVIR